MSLRLCSKLAAVLAKRGRKKLLRIRERRKLAQPKKRTLQARSRPRQIVGNVPLVHVTMSGLVLEIFEAGQIRKSACKIFGEELVYFFAMRAAYSSSMANHKSPHLSQSPAVFVVDSKNAKGELFHVYPFDTGAAAEGIYDAVADPVVYLDDYELRTEFTAVKGQIGWAFGSKKAYLEGQIRDGLMNRIPEHEFATQSFYRIAREGDPTHAKPDMRASTIEVAVSSNVPLSRLQLMILPSQLITSNVDLCRKLSAVKADVRLYKWRPNSRPSEYRFEINEILRKWYEEGCML